MHINIHRGYKVFHFFWGGSKKISNFHVFINHGCVLLYLYEGYKIMVNGNEFR